MAEKPQVAEKPQAGLSKSSAPTSEEDMAAQILLKLSQDSKKIRDSWNKLHPDIFESLPAPKSELPVAEKSQPILSKVLSLTAEEGVAEVQPLMSIAELKSSYEGFLTKDLQLPSNDFEKTDLSIEAFTASSAQEQTQRGGVESRLGDKHGVSASRLADYSSRGPR